LFRKSGHEKEMMDVHTAGSHSPNPALRCARAVAPHCEDTVGFPAVYTEIACLSLW
jgi:hypothetical protein